MNFPVTKYSSLDTLRGQLETLKRLVLLSEANAVKHFPGGTENRENPENRTDDFLITF